jgi:replicative DNA helicase
MTEDPSKSVIPHALGIEKSVLSVILQFPEVADEAPQLTSEHFHIPAHRILFERVQAIRSQGQQVELVGLVQDLLSSGLLDNCGGPAAIYDIYGYQPSPTSFPAHVARLSEHRAFRAAVRQAERLEAAAMSHDAEILAERLTEANTAILDALTDGAPAPAIGSIVEASMAAFEQRVMGADTALGIPLIPELDEHLRGAHPGRLWVIGAYPEGGKSVIASQMIIDAARDGTQCLFLTMEMAERDLMDRMIVQAARCDARAFTEPKDYARDKGMGAPSGELLKAIKRAAMTIRDSPIRLQRPANRKLGTVIASIRKASREMGIKIAAVDYLQLIRGGDHGTKEGEISEISHALQEVAQDLQITLLVLSQLNADGETKHGRVIEEDADAVIRIVQDRNKESETYKQHRHISIDKDRHYGSGGSKVPLILDRERIRFVYGEDQSQSSKPKFRR